MNATLRCAAIVVVSAGLGIATVGLDVPPRHADGARTWCPGDDPHGGRAAIRDQPAQLGLERLPHLLSSCRPGGQRVPGYLGRFPAPEGAGTSAVRPGLVHRAAAELLDSRTLLPLQAASSTASVSIRLWSTRMAGIAMMIGPARASATRRQCRIPSANR